MFDFSSASSDQARGRAAPAHPFGGNKVGPNGQVVPASPGAPGPTSSLSSSPNVINRVLAAMQGPPPGQPMGGMPPGAPPMSGPPMSGPPPGAPPMGGPPVMPPGGPMQGPQQGPPSGGQQGGLPPQQYLQMLQMAGLGGPQNVGPQPGQPTGGMRPQGPPMPPPRMSPLAQGPQRPMMGRGGFLHMMRGGYPADLMMGIPQRHAYADGDYVEPDGQGDGRSDHVNAKLSPGEYVIDAETVALLGNGNNEAGARALDKFREAIRQQKGRALARGDFSPDAKDPEAYLRGAE